MTSIEEQLEKVISRERMYRSKLLAHLEWSQKSAHLIIASTILEKRYLLVEKEEEIDFPSLHEHVFFFEVVKESSSYQRYKRMANYIYERDWLGKFSFVLTTDQFNSKEARQLLEKNYDDLIYLHNESVEIFEELQMEFRVGWNDENKKWGFYWIKLEHPFYMEEGLLCPRKHCVTEGLGIIWSTEEEAKFILDHIVLITRKYQKKGSYFTRYPAPEDFLEDFVSMMKKLSNNTIRMSELEEWSMDVLAGYSIL